jgi:hypothetical protein
MIVETFHLGTEWEDIARNAQAIEFKDGDKVHFKNKRRIINPHFAFMTVKPVYELDLSFHKPFSSKK